MSTTRAPDLPVITSRLSLRTRLRRYEEQAALIRHRAGIGPLDRLDPRHAAEALALIIMDANAIENLTAEERAWIEATTPKMWSGMGAPLADGRLFVLLHPFQTPERAAITIMEEASHVHYGHRPERLTLQPTGMERREYDKCIEEEAYWTAAAALLPSVAVARAVWRRRPANEVAQFYGTSIELVEFRIKTLGLWSEYRAYSSSQEKAG
jgi:hypothetical protein